MRVRTYIALLGWCFAVLLPHHAAAADWGTDAGSLIRIGGSDGTVDAAGEGAFFYLKSGEGFASLPQLTVVDSAYNLSPPLSFAPLSVVPNETVHVAYTVANHGNAVTDILLRLDAAGMNPRIYEDTDADGVLDPGEPELGSLGAGKTPAAEDETLAVVLQLVVPGGGAVAGGDTLAAGLDILGHNATGTDDGWPSLYLQAVPDNGDSQHVDIYLAVNYSDATEIVLAPDGMTVTADDSLVFTVTASDSVASSSWDVSSEAVFTAAGDTLGTFDGNVYHPAVAGTAVVTALFDGRLAQSVTVVVQPGSLATLVILQPAFILSADTVMQYAAAGFDHAGNSVTAAYGWRVSDTLVGRVDSSGLFTAVGAGEAYIYASYRGSRDSVAVTVVDDVPPETYLAFADSIIHCAAARITATGTDTAGHRGSPAARLSYRYRVDADTVWRSAPGGIIDLYPLEDGGHTVRVAAVDTTGNVDPTPAEAAFTVALSPYRVSGGRWRMVSVPKTAGGMVLADLAGADSAQVEYVYRWDGNAPDDRFTLQYVDMADDTLRPGASYWLRTMDDVVLSAADTAHFAFAENGALPLAAGWNQAANVFSYPVDWFSAQVVAGGDTMTMAAAVDAGILENAVHAYDDTAASSRYVVQTPADSGAVNPWEGFWVKAAQACTVLQSSEPVFSGQKPAAKAAVQAYSARDWRLRLGAHIAGAADDGNIAGVLPRAADAYDVSEPPVLEGYVSLAFDENGGRKAHSYRLAGADEYVWDVSVATDCGGSSMDLSWDGIDRIPAGIGLYLYDLADGSVTDLRKTASLRYRAASGTRRFRLVAGDAGIVPEPLPVRAAVVANDPNPFRDRTRITFAVPVENRAASGVRLDIFDARGNRVAQLVDAVLPAGTYRCSWDGTGTDGSVLPAGIYVCRLMTAGGSGASARLEVVR